MRIPVGNGLILAYAALLVFMMILINVINFVLEATIYRQLAKPDKKKALRKFYLIYFLVGIVLAVIIWFTYESWAEPFMRLMNSGV